MASSLTQHISHLSRQLWERPVYRLPLLSTGLLITTYVTIATALKLRKSPIPPSMPDTSKPCRFRLDTSTSATFQLPDGRALGYAEYGSPTGRAIIYCHGLPGCRLEAARFEHIASSANIRIIAVDRPGYGWSSPHPTRTILDYARDIKLLTEYLELDEYAVLGISGGGPYVLACAATLPRDKLRAVTVVCGIGPPDMSKRGMRLLHWLGFTCGWRYFPAITRWYFKQDPATQFHLTDEQRLELAHQNFFKSTPHPKDIEFFGDIDGLRVYIRSWRESFAQGFEGMSLDGRLLAMDFGFRIEDIPRDLPVRLWYGKLDIFVPPVHGVETAERLRGDNVLLRLEDETHASLVANWEEAIWRDLVDVM